MFLTALCGIAGSARGGEIVPLPEKVFRADVIVEVRLTFDRPIPRNWPNKSYSPTGMAFPDALIGRARASARITRRIAAAGDTANIVLPRSFHVFSSGSPCWWRAHKKKTLRVLLFFARNADGSLRQLVGVEYETGQYSDLNPDYASLTDAVTDALGWPEERMRAVAPEMLWQRQRDVLRARTNRYAVDLAVAFLKEHDAGNVVDGEMGALSEQRRLDFEREQTSFFTRTVCR